MEKKTTSGFMPFLQKTGRFIGNFFKHAFVAQAPGKKAPMGRFIGSHYTQFILLGFVFIMLQVLGNRDVLPVSLMRGIGGLMINTIVALGFFILLGYAGLASLGTAGFVGLGTYLTGYLLNNTGIPTLGVLLICVLAAIVLGVVVGFISLRIEGMYLAIITLCLSEILVQLFTNLEGITGGVNGLRVSPLPFLFDLEFAGFAWIELTRENMFMMIVAVFVILLILSKNITQSPTGRAMLTMKNSESAAQSMGVSVLKYRLLAFVIATVFAMIGGFLYEIYWRTTYPTSWGLSYSLNILAVVVIGGTKNIWGLLLGAFMIFGLNDIVLKYIPFFVENSGIIVMLNGALMILVVMFYPGGISQFIIELKYKALARKIKKGANKYAK